MNSEEYEDILYDYRILRVSARILGTLEAGCLMLLAYDQIIKGLISQGPSAFLTLINGQYILAILLTVDFIGLVIAYWKEGMGGGISLASLIVLFAVGPEFGIIFILFMGLFSLPSVLYIAYRLCIYLALKKAKRDQTTGSEYRF
jgi:hypothetical protein